jgi:hypothetical protein
LSSAQPLGSTAAANSILITSPGINFARLRLKATAGDVCVTMENHAQPLNKITTDPTIIAAAAVRRRLS